MNEGDTCPYCHKGTMVSIDDNEHVLRCDECGEYWYYSHGN